MKKAIQILTVLLFSINFSINSQSINRNSDNSNESNIFPKLNETFTFWRMDTTGRGSDFRKLTVLDLKLGKVIINITEGGSAGVGDPILAVDTLTKLYFKALRQIEKKPDTVRKTDTVLTPVYLVDVTDTVKAVVLYTQKEGGKKVRKINGFALLRGFKTMVQGSPQWADKPKIIGALDDRRRTVKNVIQVL